MNPQNPSGNDAVGPARPDHQGLDIPPRKNTQPLAANVIRGQIAHIYAGNTDTPTPQTTPVSPSDHQTGAVEVLESPYQRTQVNPATIQQEHWAKYHSAWQDYYRQYYERYYLGQVYNAQKMLEAQVAHTVSTSPSVQEQSVSKEEALYDLRNTIRDKVKYSFHRARRSRHFVPILAAIGVMMAFAFLQYNQIIFANVAAYVSPGNVNPANLIIDPTTSDTVSDAPTLIIPKINVDVPVYYNTQPTYDSLMAAMAKGVAYFGIPGADSKPGQIGNTVLSGHSSQDITDTGDYKFVFAQLSKLVKGDTIYVDYNGIRYTYTVTGSKVVAPNDVAALIYKTDKPILTLITCTPLGTAINRLLVTAEQVSPDPSSAAAAPTDTTQNANQTTTIPGNSPTVFERILGQG